MRICSSKAGFRCGIDELVHRLEPLEGVLAVEHAGVVRIAVLGEQDAAAEAAVDGGAADQHRELQSAALQFVDDQRHLLGGADQQRGEADGGGVDLDGLADDRLGRDLLAEVDDGVAVVGEDGLDQVLADVVHVAVDGGEHHRALGDAFDFLEVGLEVRDGLLHHFGGLQHEGQDQFARAELVADFLHGRQQHGC